MQTKIIHEEAGNKFIKLGFKLAIVVFVFFLISVSVALYGVAKGGSWAYAQFQNWRENRSSAWQWSPVSKIKDLFQTQGTSTIVNEPIKVVNEESQTIEVVKKAAPAVVSIIASAEVPNLERCYTQNNFDDSTLPPEFKGFFNSPVPYLCQNGTKTVRVGAGTGYLVSSDGYMLTNRHVVQDTKAEYTAILNDAKNFGKKVKAKVLARDSKNDIAVLKIDMTDLPYLTFSDSSKLQVGQTAIAIGYALGQFDNTVSKGVISGLSRSLTAGTSSSGKESLHGLIQTDAGINPGNSGGPLLDISGNVIGMNVAMAQAQSIGFAIPANAVKKIYEDVKTNGKITETKSPFLGVRYVAISDEIKTEKNLKYDYGMLLVKGSDSDEPAVVADSPAAKAGLKEGDIILEVDNKKLSERLLLSDAISNYSVGDEIALKVDSGGTVKTVKIKLSGK